MSQASQIAALESESRATTVSAAAPISPESGDLWFDTAVGQLKIYTTEWVQANKVDLLTSGVTGVYPVTETLKALKKDKIVGIASGRAEFGPRALGTRSLLADPRGPKIKAEVNKIKKRQQFRPFAPMILEELVDEYFDMPKNWKNSPYMQVTAPCKHPKKFPAIVHKDGTSRVQTVPKDSTGIRRLLEAWYRETGCPILLNTSLNVRGEPMVNDRSDADRFEKLYGVHVIS